MEAISELRLARLQKGLTLDKVYFISKGRVSPARLSRIERGLSRPSPAEAEALVVVLGISLSVIDSVLPFNEVAR